MQAKVSTIIFTPNVSFPAQSYLTIFVWQSTAKETSHTFRYLHSLIHVLDETVYCFLVHYFLYKRVWFTIVFLRLSSRYGFYAIP